MNRLSPIEPFLDRDDILIIDGGLATELEAGGLSLDTELWSADLLLSNPEAIRDVHLAYLEAGADCIVTSSYQASVAGFMKRGLSRADAGKALLRSVSLAIEARDLYLKRASASHVRQSAPLVAASIGPYGAALADGSEYKGEYDISIDTLRTFHEERWRILVDTSADLFACETIPSFREAEVLRDLIDKSPDVFAWVSFSCRDGERISDGTPITECADMFENQDQVVAIGVNCTAPSHISSLIDRLKEASQKPIIVYPNSGEVWDATRRSWIGTSDPSDFATMAREWRARGASLIGGCCRIGPQHIRAVSSSVRPVGNA